MYSENVIFLCFDDEFLQLMQKILFVTLQTISPLSDDTDDYWNSSGFKPFNFNDDVEEEDSIEVVKWDGTAAATFKPK